MPYTDLSPRGGYTDVIKDMQRRIDVVEAKLRGVRSDAFVASNATGTIECVLGQQSDGSYGLRVRNGSGVLQAVAGVQSAVGSDVLSYATNAWALSSGSLVTCNISSSGQAIVCAEASINLAPGSSASVLIGISVDGNTPNHAVGQFTMGITTGGNNPSVSLVRWDLVTGLSQGSHTFQVGYNNLVPAAAANFLGPQAIVFPL